VDFGDALVTNVDNYAFYGCRMLEQVTLPETVTYVGRYAFYNCAKLERIDIPADVEFIGMYAFSGTNNIKVFFRSFELPYYIQENWDAGIAGYFLGAKDYVVGEEWEYAITHNDTAALAVYKGSESELTLDEVDGYPVEKIGARCFYENDALTSVILCDTVNEIGNYAFMGCGSLERIDVPNAVVKIGDYAFAGSDTQVCFGEGSRLESIGKYAFSSNGTESMELADSVTSIGEGAFYRSAIKELTIGTESDLKTIGRMAFAESGLTGIYLPAGLSEVGAEAFRDTADLADITIAGGVQELKLSNSAFERAGMREITVPARVWYIGEYTFASCPNLQNIHVAAGNEAYTSVDGVLCDIYGTTLVQFPSGRTGAYEVPAQINVLTYASFKNSAIEEVTFAQGSGVKTIGWQTFSGVQELKRIELPDSLVSIDFYAFENCTALTDVVIQNNENFSGIYEGAFYNCTALKNITLPDSLTEISEYAFYGCSALEALPMSQDSKVQGIYDYAFYGCSGITEIPEFEDLTELGEYAFANTGVTEYTVSATLSGIAETAFSGAPLENIFCDETNEEYVSIEGVLFERGAVSIADTEALVVWPEAKLFVLGEGLKEITTSDTEPFRVVPVIRIAIADTVETIEGEAFRGFFNMVEIQLSDSVTDIGGSAFYNCSGLTELTIPDGVTDIGGYAFYGLSNVKVFTIGKGVERVGKLAFSNMDRLEEVHFNAVAMEDVTDSHILFNSAGRYSGGIRVNIGADVLRVPAYLFYRTTPNGGYIYNEANQVPKITSVSFAEDSACVEIGDYAFYNGKLLKQFIIPDSVITVGERAFSNCTALTDLTIGAGVQSIGKYAFSACTALEAAAFPDALETLGTGAFHNCAALADVELNENLTEIGGYAFYCCKALEQVSFPDSLESVGEHAFRGCTSMKRVDYNDGLTKIGDFAFGECTALTEVVLPDSVESVGAYTYRYCTGLERAVLGNGLSQIPSYIFYGCTVLREITVGEGVTTMEEKALAGINGLEILYFNAEEAEDLSNKSGIFRDTATQGDGFDLIIGEMVKRIPAYFGLYLDGSRDAARVRTLTFAENSICESIGVCAFGYSDTLSGALSLPDSIRDIGAYAFYSCEGINELEIGKGLKNIGSCAFDSCSGIRHMYYNAVSLESGNAMEWRSEKLDLVIGADVEVVPSIWYTWDTNCISSVSFEEGSSCTEISGRTFSRSKIQEIKIPEGVKVIGTWAFSNCANLKEIILPESVESVGVSAFENCTALERVSMGDNVVELGSSAFKNCSALQTVDLSASVDGIDEYTFYKCVSLIGIDIPDTATAIGQYAFEGCTALKSVTMGESVAEIGLRAFYNCTAVEELNYNAASAADLTEESLVFYKFGAESGGASLTIGEKVKRIPAYLFYQGWQTNAAFTTLSFAEGSVCSEIGAYAFFNGAGMPEVILPDSVEIIGESAFASCGDVETLSIGTGTREIGENAFTCYSLSAIYLNAEDLQDGAVAAFTSSRSGRTLELVVGSGVTTIPSHLFNGSAVSVLTFEENSTCTNIGDYAFNNTELRRVRIPDCVVTVGKYAFGNNERMCELTIGSGVTSIGERAFSGGIVLDSISFNAADMADLTDNLYIFENAGTESDTLIVTVGSGVKNIPAYLFRRCTGITDLEMTEGLERVGAYAFFECTGIGSLTIPDSVTAVGAEAFGGCTSVTELTIGKGLVTAGSGAFAGFSRLKSLYFNATAMEDLGAATGMFTDYRRMSGKFDVYVGANVTRIPANLFYYYDHVFGNYHTGSANVKSLVFAEDCVCAEIGYNAFKGCGTLERIEMNSASVDSLVSDGVYAGVFADVGENGLTVVLGEKITVIPNSLFAHCVNLTELDLPDGLRSIGAEAFYCCTGLTEIELPASLISIGEEAFYKCSSLTEITIPDSVTTIESGAFNGCSSVTDLTIGRGVTTVGSAVFGSCSDLEKVYFNAVAMKDVTKTYGIFNSAGTFDLYVGANVTRIPAYLFYYHDNPTGNYRTYSAKVRSLIFAEDCVCAEIGYNAFAGCGTLERIEMNSAAVDNLVSDGTYAGVFADAGENGLTVVLGEKITAIPDALFYNCVNLTQLDLPAGLTAIGAEAFCGCTGLTKLNLPTGLTSIGAEAFYRCSSLTEITIPESVTTIGAWAFRDCGIKTVNFNATAMEDLQEGNWAFYGIADNIEVTVGANVTRIPAYLFAKTTLSRLEFVNGSVCAEIGEYAFQNTKLVEVTIPESMVSIEDGAFYYCTGMEKLIFNAVAAEDCGSCRPFEGCGTQSGGFTAIFGEGVTRIPGGLFENCKTLIEVTIPESVTVIGDNAFNYSIGLEKIHYNAVAVNDFAERNSVFDRAGDSENGIAVTVGPKVTRIPAYLFSAKNWYGNEWTSANVTSLVFVEDSVCESIGAYAFRATKLTDLTIPESVTVLESGAFYDCNQLENIRFEAAELEALNSSSDVFGNCGSADVGLKVTFGENVKKIPDYLFDSCNGLTEVDFGSVGEIGAYAFQNCENLQKVELPNAVTAIGTNAFYICIGLKEVTIPESLTTLGSQAFRGCKQLEKISYNAAALADLPDKNFVFYDAGTSGSGIAVTVGSNVTRIPAYLFCSKNTYGGDYSSTNVTSLAFAENGICESIGTYAFHGTNLTELTIPESVNDLGAYAFYECKKLGEIRFNAASVGDLSSSSRVFSRCGTESSEGLKVTFGPSITRVPRYLFYNCSGLTSIDLGNVTEIAACAFESCIALKEVTIPENLTVLGGYAFNGCRMLEKVNFNAAALGDLNQKNYVFYNAGADTEGIAVTIGPEVTRIPAYLFCTYNGSSYLSTKVGSLTFAENGVCESVGICAFRGSKLTELTIPESVTNLEKQAFYQCGNLVSIQIDAPDLSVASDVFEKCGSADVGLKVSFGSSVKKVPDYLFDGCTGLTEIDFGSVSEIGVYAFGGCTSLKELTIPENIEVIGNSAFYGCRGLEKINFNATALGDLPQKNYVFEYAGMDGSGIAVTVGANVTHIPAYLFSTYDGSYRCPNNVSSLAFEEGSACQSIGASAFRGTNLTSLTIPEGVTTLGTQAFYGCTLLENIFCNAAEIEGLTSKSQVFSDCGSESDRLKVTFGESVASVPEYLFYNCTGLTDIDFGAISEIGACAFYGCTELESVELSDEVTAIGVSAFNNCDGLKELTIPENVEVIGNRAFAYCDALEKVNFNATAMNDLAQGNCAFYNAGTGDEGISVMVAANVTRIPAYLFCAYDGSYYRSTNVSSLVFEEGSECRSIGAYAFRGTNLKEITIPEKVTALGAYAFNSCPALEKINFRAVSMDDIATGGYVFNESGAENGIAVVVGSDVTRIPAYLFCGKNYNNAYASANVSSLQFEEGSVCTGVGDYAFRGTGITEALLPEGIEEIGTGAFYGCSALQKVTIPESVESLGNSAFSGCIGLEKLVLNATLSDFTGSSYVFNNAGADSEGIAVTVGAGVNRIPAYLFRSNSSSANVTSLIFEEGSVCESIGEYAFRGTGIVKLVLPESITAIGDFAFAGCVNLAEVTIPKNMTEVGYHLFNGCTSLEIIHFNTTAMSDLSTSPFLNVGGEKGITMIVGANVTRIPNNLFSAYSSFSYGETNLTSLIFEEGSVCKSIGYRAFPGSRLVKVDLPDSIETIGGYAFYQCYDLTEINIPVSTTKIGIDAFGLCSALEVVHFDAAAMEDLGEKGDIFSNGGKNVGMDIFVGNQVTRIPAHLFHETTHYSHCPKINSVVFAEDSVCESIGTYAFCNTGIECITIPESVKMIGDTAFLGCDMTLVTIESPDIAAAITQEGSCGLLALSRTTLSIPADITQIGTYVTEGYGMQEAITLDGKGYILYSKHTHDWQYSSTIAEPIACEKDGLDRYTCSCDAQKDVVVSCHVLTENEAKAPTCTAVGWDAYETCENCSYTTYWEIPATGHSHKAKVTEPTCTEQGYTTYTCHCGDSYMADYVDALGHDWGEWTETLAPDCTTEGEERRDCGRCDHFETNVLDATGHSHKAKVTEPTCTEQGYTTYTCHCGDSYVADYVDAAGHSFEAWRWTRQPHCETEGKKRRDCENCDAYETKTYDALGHEWGEWTALSETQHKRVCGRDELHIECGDHEWFDGICDVCHHSGIDAEKGDGILKLRLPGFAAGTRILLATYNSEGRMLGVTSQLATQEEYYSIAFNSAAAKIKVMLLAPEWTPLRGSLNG